MVFTDHKLCECGSGLRPARCCQIDLSTLAPAEATRHLLPLAEQAAQAYGRGALPEAERLCLEVLELAPGQPAALTTLYQIRRAANHGAAAMALIRRIVSLDPNNFWATNEIALLLFNKGDLAEAEVHARNAVRIAPCDPQSHNLKLSVPSRSPAIRSVQENNILEELLIRLKVTTCSVSALGPKNNVRSAKVHLAFVCPTYPDPSCQYRPSTH